MSKSLLLTRPNHDNTTNYLCFWSESVIGIAESKKFNIYDLKGKKANKANFESYLKARKPDFLFLNGHGNANSMLGHNNEPILESSSTAFVKGLIIYARSCDVGQSLGSQLISSGVKVFIGYDRNFVFGYTHSKITKPFEDPLAKLFLEPSNLVVTTLLKGNTAQESHERSKEAMWKNLRKMLSSIATDEEKRLAPYLWSNIKGQVLYGDQTACI